jgi:hypothetical protein
MMQQTDEGIFKCNDDGTRSTFKWEDGLTDPQRYIDGLLAECQYHLLAIHKRSDAKKRLSVARLILKRLAILDLP